MRGLLVWLIASTLLAGQESSVGMRTMLEDLVLPGPELEVKPIDALASPVVVRMVSVLPHGSDFRYTFEYYALEEGSHNLLDYLQPKNGVDPVILEPVELVVSSILPPGQSPPMMQKSDGLSRMGGYRLLWKVVLGLWVVGLALLIFYRKRAMAPVMDPAGSVTFDDLLRPKVEAALAGDLDASGRAELERMLLTFWREKLDLKEEDVAESLKTLRVHEEAGPLLVALEDWLHRPNPVSVSELEGLLEPYRDDVVWASRPPEPDEPGEEEMVAAGDDMTEEERDGIS